MERGMLDLRGKVAVVTGAGSGIGRGIALAYARAGADVAAADIVEERAEATAKEVAELGQRSLAIGVDVRDRTALGDMAARVSSEMGRLDICVANAGIGRGGTVLTMREEDWDSQIEVNLKGVFLTVQACSREMVRHNNGGRVVTISSLAAERPSAGLFAYCASKAGVRMMTRCWALELAPFGITVNAIGPGVIDTPLAAPLVGEGDDRARREQAIPAGRMGFPEDIGNLATWLASDEAEYITGTYNLIDGGLADASGFGLPSDESPMLQLRNARRAMSGDQLLAMIDAATAQALAEGEQQRIARGLQ
jgi:NAD(P)-dependent dehydrogenase (short-subunit alcohol dehydrogenase family)